MTTTELTASEMYYWQEKVDDRAGALVISGMHHWIGPEDDPMPPSLRGCGGRRFVVECLATGQRTVTTNLWCQGSIPPAFREQLPDTHRFVEDK